jgi:ketosteroid isomerase-like protein
VGLKDSKIRHENVQTVNEYGKNMSIIAAYNDAWNNVDVDALAEILHDDFVFNPHVGGVTMGKSDALGFAGTAAVTSEEHRILFENDDVGVAHSVVHFTNGSTSEAVLSFMRFKDGKIVSMETGATPLSDDYRVVGSD